MNFEQYTERARGFIQSAQTGALAAGNQQFTPEHLLKVLLDDEEGLAAGLIERRRDPDDDRALAVSLTVAGVALRERALAVPGQIMERLGIGIPEVERARDALNAILAATHEPAL